MARKPYPPNGVETWPLGELCGLGEFRLHRFFMCEALLNTGPLLQTLKVSLAILIFGKIEFELRATTEAPEKMCIRGREMVEEKLAPSEQVVGDLIAFIELSSGQLSHTLIRTRYVTHPSWRIDASEERVNARSAPRHD